MSDFLTVRSTSNLGKISVSIICGLLVGTVTASTHWFILPHDQALLIHAFLADLIAGLSTVIVCLAIGLRNERAYFIASIYSVSLVSKLNHQLRSAVFLLCLMVQKTNGDKETAQLAEQAMERINAALRQATANAIFGRARNEPKISE